MKRSKIAVAAIGSFLLLSAVGVAVAIPKLPAGESPKINFEDGATNKAAFSLEKTFQPMVLSSPVCFPMAPSLPVVVLFQFV